MVGRPVLTRRPTSIYLFYNHHCTITSRRTGRLAELPTTPQDRPDRQRIYGADQSQGWRLHRACVSGPLQSGMSLQPSQPKEQERSSSADDLQVQLDTSSLWNSEGATIIRTALSSIGLSRPRSKGLPMPIQACECSLVSPKPARPIWKKCWPDGWGLRFYSAQAVVPLPYVQLPNSGQSAAVLRAFYTALATF